MKRSNRQADGPRESRTQRQLRVGEMLRQALAHLLERGEAHDPGLRDVSITVTEVRVSADFRNATAFVLPLGGDRADETLAALNRAAPYLRRRVAEEITLRVSPTFRFEIDRSFETAERIESLLRSPKTPRDSGGSADHDS